MDMVPTAYRCTFEDAKAFVAEKHPTAKLEEGSFFDTFVVGEDDLVATFDHNDDILDMSFSLPAPVRKIKRQASAKVAVPSVESVKVSSVEVSEV
jgi:hypothetical protein